MQHSPSPYECAVLSHHVYHAHKSDLRIKEGDIVEYPQSDDHSGYRLGDWIVYKKLGDGKPLRTLGIIPFKWLTWGPPYGYNGVIYKNIRKNHFVLANRGTEPRDFNDLRTDLFSVALSGFLGGSGHERAMRWATEELVKAATGEDETEVSGKVTDPQEAAYLTLTTTGHSLGGWLAQLATLAIQKEREYGSTTHKAHLKAITFDTPGARPMLEKLNCNIEPYDLDQLDITNYLSMPNLVNTCNRHVGTTFQIIFQNFPIHPGRYTLTSHAMQEFLKAFDPATGDTYNEQRVCSWPDTSQKYRGFQGIYRRIGLEKILQRRQLERDESTSADPFERFYISDKSSYQVGYSDRSTLHIRHVSPPVRKFLRNLHEGSYACQGIVEGAKEKDPWLEEVTWDDLEKRITVPTSDPATLDLRIAVDRLLDIVLANPYFLQELKGLRQVIRTQWEIINELVKSAGNVSFDSCNYQESVKWAKKSLDLMQSRHPGKDHPDVAYSLNRVGVSLKEVANYEEALRYQKEALEMRKRILREDESNSGKQEHVAYSLSEVGGTLARLGKYAEALDYKAKALHIRRNIFEGQDHPGLAHSLNSVGELLTHLGNYNEGLKEKQEALAMRERLDDRDHPDIARSLTGVGIGLESCGKYPEALEHKKRALAMYQRLYGRRDHPSLGHALNNVGETLIKAAHPAVFNPEEGIKHCKEALDMRSRLYPDLRDHLQIAHSLHCIGLGLCKLARLEEGFDKFREALIMYLRLYPEDPHPYMKRMVQDLRGLELEEDSKQKLIKLCKEAMGAEHYLMKEIIS
ncbi:MAG: tetratricopeptide repeat protein [Bacteroidota bacterium]